MLNYYYREAALMRSFIFWYRTGVASVLFLVKSILLVDLVIYWLDHVPHVVLAALDHVGNVPLQPLRHNVGLQRKCRQLNTACSDCRLAGPLRGYARRVGCIGSMFRFRRIQKTLPFQPIYISQHLADLQ